MQKTSVSKLKEYTDAICNHCGTMLSVFLESGRCGCPECYRVFAGYLSPILLKNTGSHRGRVPLAVQQEERKNKTYALQEKISQAYRAGDALAVKRLSAELRALQEEG